MKRLTLATSLILITLVVPSSFVASAAEDEEEAGAKVDIPATVPAILASIDAHRKDLAKTIADGKLAEVHEIAFAIRDLVAALPAKSQDLDASDLASLEKDVKFVAALAKRLDESGDDGDQASTEANFKKLEGILDRVAAPYAAHEK